MSRINEDWDRFDGFHKRIAKENPKYNEGVNAALEISEFARKLDLIVPLHSTYNVRFCSNIHYDWLIQANELLKIVEKIPHFEARIRRFFNTDDVFDSLSALYEIEVALKFKIQGFDVRFLEETQIEKTPDMEVKFTENTFNVEVTTINNPDEVREKAEFYRVLNRMMVEHKVNMAGNMVNVSVHREKSLLQEIEAKAVKVSKNGEKTKISKDGVIILEIVPWGKKNILTFQGIRWVHRELKDIEDIINLKLESKQSQLNKNEYPGILCIYGGSRTINIEEIYTNSKEKINPCLQTYSNISALVLSSYSVFYPLTSLKDLISQTNNKILKELKPGFGELEQSIIWNNGSANVNLPIEFIKSYEDIEL